MEKFGRREFLQSSATLFAGALVISGFASKKNTPKLSFSTLGCPDWTFKEIVDFANKHAYRGIEVRGILRQLDLPQCPDFSKQNIPSTLRLMEDNDLRFVNLGSSATLHFSESSDRTKNIDDGKRFIDLASQLKCPYIRVFPNIFPKDQEKNTTMNLIAKGLRELGEYAKGSNVTVLIESHGDLLFIEDLYKVMNDAEHPNVGMIWDVTNMWSKTKEPPKAAYEKLKKYIRHTHIKDAKLADGKISYVRLGTGDVPIFEAIDALSQDNYRGYYCFEWEKLWHPEIEAPEIAFVDYSVAMAKHFK